ncbi:Fumarylacetoacetate hydrolase domain-containing protein 2 [uncultured Sphingopyxis sp.]|uniref:Fumarylacetoacetate hydrolase domain-containing protein 2 n=1 Tax=uncultured Sphingopyxis sp. TaxID=310581 RepID=A0A1Y5Q1M7_9SPHN|nr:fumarylacetoacetate hydrolase family protein [uncultured Sphingopyxis sp.]SBV33374.1 Fumarylacetoacetate hydrolase domain-containing protein 2 [uncultured Sphingopyxis sp.]
MRFVTYRTVETEPRLGLLHDGLVIDVEYFGDAIGQDLPSTMLDFIDLGPIGLRFLREAIDSATTADLIGTSLPEGNVSLLAPIPRPRKNIFGIGLNYTEHVAESARSLDTSKELPQQPVIFSKPPTAVAAWNDPIGHNAKVTQQLDWETELAVVIGSTARRVTEADALNHVFGYTVINDVSARDCRRAGQWIVSKGQDGFAPMGPCIVTRDEIGDPHDLNILTHVNGVEKQNSNTRFMLFNINQLIADISSVMTLEPGDIIATGTPAGVGAGRDPQEFMWPGDVVECTIEGIGTLRNPIVAA